MWEEEMDLASDKTKRIPPYPSLIAAEIVTSTR